MCTALCTLKIHAILSSLWRFPIRRFLLCWWRIELRFYWFACISTSSLSSQVDMNCRKALFSRYLQSPTFHISTVIVCDISIEWTLSQHWLTTKAVLFDMDGAMEVQLRLVIVCYQLSIELTAKYFGVTDSLTIKSGREMATTLEIAWCHIWEYQVKVHIHPVFHLVLGLDKLLVFFFFPFFLFLLCNCCFIFVIRCHTSER